ncbi:hypothetical protein ELH24_09305 [Rhizobium ruizarguesonis]|nr:hypothetical protein [Rhizobium leguminosarum]TBD15713.1 hypothetical protein ELH24_09305 [Rhizobium ruizarguesonis]
MMNEQSSKAVADLDARLVQEYTLVYDRIGKFNATIQSTRGWFLTAFAGLWVFLDKNVLGIVFLFAFLLGTWLSEGYVRAAQQRLYPRIDAIERHFRGEVRLSYPFQVRTQALAIAYSIGGFVHATRMMLHVECYIFYLVFFAAAVFMSAVGATAGVSITEFLRR